MDIQKLLSYLKETQNYIEFSFYKNSSDIMGAISKDGIDKVLSIISMKEMKKGSYECISTWKVGKENCLSKTVTIDMSGEMIFITESIDTNDSNSLENKSIKSNPISDIDIQREYGEILSLLKSKSLSNTEKNILTKVVAAFFS